MTQWVKGLATKHDDLGSVTRSHMVEGENQLLQVTQPLAPTMARVYATSKCNLKAFKDTHSTDLHPLTSPHLPKLPLSIY